MWENGWSEPGLAGLLAENPKPERKERDRSYASTFESFRHGHHVLLRLRAGTTNRPH